MDTCNQFGNGHIIYLAYHGSCVNIAVPCLATSVILLWLLLLLSIRYLLYWKGRFLEQPVSDFCSVIKTNSTGPVGESLRRKE